MKKMNHTRYGYFCVLAAAVLWSTGGLLIKFIPWNSMVINSVRSILALGFFVVVHRGFHIKITPNVILAALCLTGTTTLYVAANKLTTAANAIVLQYLSPIFVLAFTCIKEKKLPTVKQLIILLVAFGGTVLFFLDQLDGGRLLGNLLAIASGVAFAGVFFMNSSTDVDSNDSFMLGFILSFLLGLPFYGHGGISCSVKGIIAVLLLGILQVGLAYWVFGLGVKYTNPVTASLLGLIEAVLNPLWVLLALGERPGKWALFGGVLILGAIAANLLLNREEDRPSSAESDS